MSQVWLTPDQLTVRPIDALPEVSNYRFAVRAQFDDNVVGDLTDGHGVTWPDSGGHVGQDGSITLLAGDNAGDNFFVTATLPAELGSASTPLGPSVQVGTRWSDEPTPPPATIVAGGAMPATGDAELAPNILLLGDGFRGGDEDSFNGIVNEFVQYMKSNQMARPFDLLSARMNFWQAFYAADQVGISFRSEMYISDDDEAAMAIPAVAKPPATGQWSLAQLLYAVGLPIPGDDGKDPGALTNEWTQLLQVDPAPHINTVLVGRWQQLAKRAFLEERDGFPGMSYGAPPAASLTDTTMLNLHEDRAGVEGLVPFYSVLASDDVTLGDGRAIGVLWAEDTFRFHNRTLVVLISSFPGGRGLNSHVTINGDVFGYIAVSTKGGNAEIPVQKVDGKNSYTLNLDAVPTDVEADRSRTVAHELGHSFGLGDEYEDFDKPFPRPHANPAHANLQTEADTQIQDPNDATKRIITGDQIPWIWHRITAAAVVDVGTIGNAGAGQFRIPVVPDVSFRFAQGDTVLLRRRTWGEPLHKLVPNNVPPDLSPALVVAEQPDTDAIVVSAAPGVNVTLADLQTFPDGSLIYAPKPAAPAVLSATYLFAELVAKNIKDAITSNQKPLTEVPCVFDGAEWQIPILSDFEGRTPVAGVSQDAFLDMVKIVGLYSGGAQFSCGIFHPTGRCMMRNDHEDQAEFCAVCRYIMVDLIAPEFHSDIDADYDTIYGQTLGTLNG